MPYLVAAMIIVGLLCLLDLLLTVGVIRRLRAHSEALSMRISTGPPEDGMLPAGSPVGDFATVTTVGEPLSDEDLENGTVIGFLSPDCGPCREQLPGFVEFARSQPGGQQSVVSVVLAAPDEAAEMVSALAPVARVTVEDHLGPVSDAFGVNAFPSFCRVGRDGGQLIISEYLQLETMRSSPVRSCS